MDKIPKIKEVYSEKELQKDIDDSDMLLVLHSTKNSDINDLIKDTTELCSDKKEQCNINFIHKHDYDNLTYLGIRY